ncbi:unnamed protein product [Calicophoron daubneyi]|uniref:Uncharacterized protein n=1 Tax=Calicophoron daubneyi TaxID=300641 RepID=A0AAV2TBM3_CALDB
MSKNLQLMKDNKKLGALITQLEDDLKKCKNERDYHILKHRRILQERDELQKKIRRLSSHYAEYEPVLRQLKHKYEVAMKEKTLNRVERDRAIGQAEGLRAALHSLQKLGIVDEGEDPTVSKQKSKDEAKKVNESEQSEQPELLSSAANAESETIVEVKAREHTSKVVSGGGISELPADRHRNPNLLRYQNAAVHIPRTAGRKMNISVKAHESAASFIAVHAQKPWLCTTGDDRKWKLWDSTNLEPLLTVNAHDDWISSVDFHPKDRILTTASGDSTVKLWAFDPTTLDTKLEGLKANRGDENSKSVKNLATLRHHTGAVWSVSWHWDGRFLASSGIDGTVCLWDAETAKKVSSPNVSCQTCRVTFRKHCGSVNSARFLPFGNILVTASTDKTVALWDVRTGICLRTFLGHKNSVNYADFNQQGTCVASCDNSGVIRLWDLRRTEQLDATAEEGQSSRPLTVIDLAKGRKSRLNLGINQVAFELNSEALAGACTDGRVCVVEVTTGQVSSLYGHEDAVQSVAFDYNSDALYSVSNDGRICMWN